MMIEVKSTKSESKEPIGAERYATADKSASSKAPSVVAAALIGIALYIGQFFDSVKATVAVDEPEPDANPPDDSLSPARGVHPTSPSFSNVRDYVSGETGTKGPRAEEEDPGQSPARSFSSSNGSSGYSTKVMGRGEVFRAKFEPVANNGGLAAFALPAEIPIRENSVRLERGGTSQDAQETVDDLTGGIGGDTITGDDTTVPPPSPQANRTPRSLGQLRLNDIVACAGVLILTSDLLQKSFDPDGDVLSINQLTASSGTLAPVAGGWMYTPDPQILGPVVLSYSVSDAELSVAQTAQFSIVPHDVVGTDWDDNILGSNCGDEIQGLAGDDNIDARAGNDIIFGGRGDDHIVAGDGNDTVYADAGNDIVFGGRGNDVISGGTGNDMLYGDEGNDIIFGDEGNDTIEGGDGDDIVFGGTGADDLSDGIGSDVVMGGDGNDVVHVAGDDSEDQFDGGEGKDTLDLSAAKTNLTIDLRSGTVSGNGNAEDHFVDFEDFFGGSGDDHFIADKYSASFTGGEGNDTYEFSCRISPATPAVLVFQIMDFEVGDRINSDRYSIFEKDHDESDDDFHDFYANDADEQTKSSIRYHQDDHDTYTQTVIEIDHDHDSVFETTIMMQGNHFLFMIEAT